MLFGRKRTLTLCALLLLASALTSSARGATVVEADPKVWYGLHEGVGPWLVLAASYSGPVSRDLAHQTTIWLRAKHNYPAFILDRGDKERKEQDERVRKLREQYGAEARVRMVRIEEQYAVLIGGFKDMETAKEVAAKVKKLEKPDIKLSEDRTKSDVLLIPDPNDKKRVILYETTPFYQAFVVRNPLIPQDKAQNDGKIDAFVVKLNDAEEYSLFKCKGPFTLLVAAYQGTSSLQSTQTSTVFSGMNPFSKSDGKGLGASGLQAHSTAEWLRKVKFEAYVFHDRQASYVTVGSFASADDPNLQKLAKQITNNQSLAALMLVKEPQAIRVPQKP